MHFITPITVETKHHSQGFVVNKVAVWDRHFSNHFGFQLPAPVYQCSMLIFHSPTNDSIALVNGGIIKQHHSILHLSRFTFLLLLFSVSHPLHMLEYYIFPVTGPVFVSFKICYNKVPKLSHSFF
jgi:hypothetical protein